MRTQKRRALLCLLLSACLLAMTLVMTSCEEESTADRNAIVSVVPDGEDSLVLEARLTKGFLSGYEEDHIYLFELPSAFSTAADLSRLSPVTRIKPKANLRITVPLTDGVRTRLYSSFLLASYDPDSRTYTPLTTPMAVSGIEGLAARPELPRPETSIKGLITDEVADAVGMGIAHTLVDVDMARLICKDWGERTVSYVYGGHTAYLDRDGLAELDELVGAYTRSGVEVYLRFLLKAPTENTPPELYALKNPAKSDAECFAVNMDSEAAARRMEGFFTFMADRYADPEGGQAPVTAFVLGWRVNDPKLHNAAGDVTLAAYVTGYEKLVRVADAALRSHNASGRVYISLDSHRSAATMQGGWDVPTFLAAFRDECALRGDYPWQVAGELTAATPTLWPESTSLDNEFYTLHSLGTLTDLLGSASYADPNGNPRSLAITGFSVPAALSDGVVTQESLEDQAASYAYAYMVCLQNPRVEALIYSDYADVPAQNSLRGLRGVATDAEGGVILQEKRPICGVFEKMDTTDAGGLSAALTELIGSAYTKLEASLAGRVPAVTAVSGEGKVGELVTSRGDAAILFAFDGGLDHGFGSGGGLTYTALNQTETLQGHHAYLYACFGESEAGNPGGITVSLPAKSLIGGKSILLDLYARDMADPTADRTGVTLRLLRPATGSVAEGDGAVLYESRAQNVSGGRWQTVSFDISSFADLLEEEDTVILTVSVDAPGARACELGLAEVSVTGNTVGSPLPIGLVVTVIIILILLVAGVFLLLLLRNKDKRSDDQPTA